MNRDDFVIGEIKLPLFRSWGTRIAYPLMRIGFPGASWLYFRCLFGAGVNFTAHHLDMD